MTRARSWQPCGAATALTATYYAQRASAGMIITESSQISDAARGYGGTPGIHTPEHIAGWRLVCDAVHKAGGRIFCQLWHAGRVSHEIIQPMGAAPLAPSPIRARDTRVFAADETGKLTFLEAAAPRELAGNEISQIIDAFAASARAAIDAGLDGVEIHAANGFLIDQFLRSTTNRRNDEFGGTPSRRVRFLESVVAGAIGEVGADRVGVRLSPFVYLKDMEDPEIVETTLLAIERLQRLRVAYVHFAEAEWDTAPQVEQAFRAAVRSRFPGTIIVSGGFDALRAEPMLRSGFADLVGFGRMFIGNPDLPRRLKENAELREFDRSTLYGGGAIGYTDYPPLG